VFGVKYPEQSPLVNISCRQQGHLRRSQSA
jgi:hypothetical protein